MLCVACTDDDSFTTSPSYLLTFSTDTVKMDTVFSKIPSSTRTFWVFNRSGEGIRCVDVRLANGNQTGYRVNVDGVYLGQSAGYQTHNLEIRNKDSIRVFVELTSPENGYPDPQILEDNLVFTLESGAVQKVNLNAYTWDADILTDVTDDARGGGGYVTDSSREDRLFPWEQRTGGVRTTDDGGYSRGECGAAGRQDGQDVRLPAV